MLTDTYHFAHIVEWTAQQAGQAPLPAMRRFYRQRERQYNMLSVLGSVAKRPAVNGILVQNKGPRTHAVAF